MKITGSPAQDGTAVKSSMICKTFMALFIRSQVLVATRARSPLWKGGFQPRGIWTFSGLESTALRPIAVSLHGFRYSL